MANKTTTGENAATLPLSGSELIRGVQLDGNVKFTAQDVANLVTFPLTTKGDIFIRGTTGIERLPAGTDGYVLSANSTVEPGLQYIAPGISATNLSASNGSSLVGFIQVGTGAVARTDQDELRETVKVTQFGAVAGASDSTTALQLAINYIGVGTKLIIPPGVWNFTNLTFTGKTDFQLEVQGQLVNIGTKPGGTAVDMRSTQSGLQTINFSNCARFKVTGNGNIQNGFREALYFSTCTDFDVTLDCRGNGTNDNLVGVYLRYCQRFHFGRMTLDGVTLKPTNNVTEVYGNWTNNVQIWDCSDFVFDNGFTSRNSGMNGIYPGSNCTDFVITDCILEYNAGSGCQMAWSSFGTFPIRWNFSKNIVRYNQADGLDVNNTSGSGLGIYASIQGNIFLYNGWINGNPANAAGVDGSGIGTFFSVNNWVAQGNEVIECASHGVFVSNCNFWNISGGSIIKSNTGTQNDGLYITAGAVGLIEGVSIAVLPALSALVTLTTSYLTIRDCYFNGQLSFSSGTYTSCKFIGNKATAYTQTSVVMDWLDNDIDVGNSAQNGLFVSAPGCKIQRNRVSATNAGIINSGFNYTDISGNTITAAGGEGIIVTASTGVRVEGNNSSTTANAAGIHLSGACVNCSLAMNQGGSSGGGNSFLVDAAATLTQKWGNIGTGGASSFGGTYGVNF